MNPQIQKLQAQLDEIQTRLDLLQNSTTIPWDVGEAFKERVGSLKDIATKTAASETQAVNEAGVGAYSVAKVMDGFYTTADGKYIPYYD